MVAREIEPNILSVGAIDWDRRLFDELIPLPDGTTYNSYLIKGKEKIALIDTVDPTKISVLLNNLKEAKIERIDYIISHHAEQDHSGGIPEVLKAYPEARVVTNAKCKGMLIDLLLIPEDKFIVIEDRQTLSLGDKTLEFIFAPWVHWPETFLTYLKEEKILFTCDFFGSHLAQSIPFVRNTEASKQKVLRSAKRYYAEIMMPFRTSIKKHLEVLKAYEIKMIAPSHGPVYPDPAIIMNSYQNWVGDEVKNEVVIPYVSMHGSTQVLVDRLMDALQTRGIKVKPFNLSRTDIGELAMALVDAATVVVGSPTVLAAAHPQAIYATALFNALRPKTHYLSIVGSFGWGGKMVEQLSGLLTGVKVEVIPPVIIKGYPKPADLAAIDNLAEAILVKHNQDNFIKKVCY
jgi:flavorubredoxin